MTTFERAARAHIASRGSKGTRALYGADLESWLEHCAESNIDPDGPSLEAATSFRDTLKGQLSAQTVRRVLSALSSMYEAAGLPNMFSGKRLQRPPADEVALTREFSEEEAQAILKAAEADTSNVGIRDTAILRLLYDTGLRVSSVVEMKRNRIFRRGVDGQQVALARVKKKGLVEVELPEASAKALVHWLEVAPESDWVFPSVRSPNQPIACSVVNKRLLVYGAQAGVPHAHPHRFRATLITRALDLGIPLNQVQAAVHHADPKTTLRYDRGARGTGVANAVAESRKKPSHKDQDQ